MHMHDSELGVSTISYDLGHRQRTFWVGQWGKPGDFKRNPWISPRRDRYPASRVLPLLESTVIDISFYFLLFLIILSDARIDKSQLSLFGQIQPPSRKLKFLLFPSFITHLGPPSARLIRQGMWKTFRRKQWLSVEDGVLFELLKESEESERTVDSLPGCSFHHRFTTASTFPLICPDGESANISPP